MCGPTMMKIIAIEEKAPRPLTFLVHALVMPSMGFDETGENWVRCFQGKVALMCHQVVNNKVDRTISRNTQAHKERGSVRGFEEAQRD